MRGRDFAALAGFAVLAALVATPGAAHAQQPPQARAASTGTAAAAADAERAPTVEPRLMIDREVFAYPGAGRRDPFRPLEVADGMGPLFEDLVLRGIIHAPPDQSVALLATPDGRIFRARRGAVVGNTRVLDITADRVVFAVDNFGVVRQQQLFLKRKETEG
jgi:hypothetical protein